MRDFQFLNFIKEADKLFSKKKVLALVTSALALLPLVTGCGAGGGGDDDGEFTTPVLDGRLTGYMGDLSSPSVPCSGRTLYISASASSEGSGTSSSPFKTFAVAARALQPGDSLVIQGTFKNSERIKLSSIHGSAGNYITIKGASGATLSGEKITRNDNKILKIEDCSYLKIERLSFCDHTRTKNGGGGIGIYPASHHIVIDNCTFTNLKTTEPTNHGTTNGIIVYGDSTTDTIHDIFISNNSFSNMATGWAECLTVTANVEYVNLISNTIDTTGNIGIDVGGNYGYCDEPSKDFARYIYIYGNTVKNCVSPNATAGSIYCDGGQHIIIRNNRLYDGETGFSTGAEQVPISENYSTGDILIEDNYVENFHHGVWHCGGWQTGLGWVQSVRFINNTGTNTGYGEHQAVIVFNKCRNIDFSGNTFTNPDHSGVTKVYYSFKDSPYTKNVSDQNNSWGW